MPTNLNDQRQALRALVRGVYDLQKLRIEMGNRICAAFRSKLGLKPPQKEEEDKEVKKTLDLIRLSFKKITDGIKKELPAMKDFKGDQLISTYTELCLVAEYLSLESGEAKHFRRIEKVLSEFPIYTQFLKGVKGCGPAMSGVIISEIDIHHTEYPSSLWKYAGLDVARYLIAITPDGKTHKFPDWDTALFEKFSANDCEIKEEWSGRSRRGEHLVKVTYKNKAGKEAERDSITFNPWLKTKLMGVLGGCFLKNNNPRYRKAYDDYHHRLETTHHVMKLSNDERRIAEFKARHGADKKYSPKAHRHNMSLRYMVKLFLADLYNEWRAMEGLPVAPSYNEAKSGKVHGIAA